MDGWMASSSSSSSTPFPLSQSLSSTSSLATQRTKRPSLKLSPFCARDFFEILSPVAPRASSSVQVEVSASTSSTPGASAEILSVALESLYLEEEVEDQPVDLIPSHLTDTMTSLTATATATTTYPTAPFTPLKSKPPSSSHPSSSSKLQDSPFSDYFTDDNASLPPQSSPIPPFDAAGATPEKKQLLLRMGKLQDLLVRGGDGEDETETIRIVERKIGEIENQLAAVHAQTRVAAEMEDSGLFLEDDSPLDTGAGAEDEESHPFIDPTTNAQHTLSLLTKTTSHLRTQHDALRALHDTHLSQLDALRAENASLRSRIEDLRHAFEGMEREVCAVEDAAERLVGYEPGLAVEIRRTVKGRVREVLGGWRSWDFEVGKGEEIFEAGVEVETWRDGVGALSLDGGDDSGDFDDGEDVEVEVELGDDAQCPAQEPRDIKPETSTTEPPTTVLEPPLPPLFSSPSLSSNSNNEEPGNETDPDDHDPALTDEDDLQIDCAITTSSEDNNLSRPVSITVAVAVEDPPAEEELSDQLPTKTAWQELWDSLSSLAGMGEGDAGD